VAAVVGAVRAHPRITFVVVVLLAALVVLRLITPPLADVRDAVEGDCFAGSPLTISANIAGEVHTVPGYATGIQRVGCAEPHIWESLGPATLPGAEGAPYPVNDMQALAADACAARFATFVGRPLAGSQLSATAFYPTREDWEARDVRLVACMIVDPSADTVTGTLRGAGR
jgi:hypothetical protein